MDERFSFQVDIEHSIVDLDPYRIILPDTFLADKKKYEVYALIYALQWYNSLTKHKHKKG